MAVLVPLNNADALGRLHDAGAEELYVGFHDGGWDARFGPGADLNRMSGFGREANPFDFGQACGHIGRAAKLGMRAYVCFNAAAYTPEQASFIACEYLPELARAGAAGIIVSGQALIGDAREAGLEAVASTMAGIFNERLAAHYRDRGATRLILPRDLALDEIAGIMGAVPEVEYEVFLMRNGCVFSDSHCLGRHCAGKPSLCLSLREGSMDVRPVGMGGPAADELVARASDNERIWAGLFHRRTCGLCALWRFEQLGVHAYKVVGRGDAVDDLVADAALVARNAALARTCATEADYLACMERPREPETLCGYEGLSCYYPDPAYWQSWAGCLSS